MNVNELLKDVNVASLVRSGVVLILGAPVVLGLGANFDSIADATNRTGPSDRDNTVAAVQSDIARDCINFVVSKEDTKMERDAKNALDEYFGGEVDYKGVCEWAFS